MKAFVVAALASLIASVEPTDCTTSDLLDIAKSLKADSHYAACTNDAFDFVKFITTVPPVTSPSSEQIAAFGSSSDCAALYTTFKNLAYNGPACSVGGLSYTVLCGYTYKQAISAWQSFANTTSTPATTKPTSNSSSSGSEIVAETPEPILWTGTPAPTTTTASESTTSTTKTPAPTTQVASVKSAAPCTVLASSVALAAVALAL